MRSYKDLGKPLLDPANAEAWEGISVYNTDKRALYAAKMPAFRAHKGIVRLSIPILFVTHISCGIPGKQAEEAVPGRERAGAPSLLVSSLPILGERTIMGCC